MSIVSKSEQNNLSPLQNLHRRQQHLTLQLMQPPSSVMLELAEVDLTDRNAPSRPLASEGHRWRHLMMKNIDKSLVREV